MYGYGGLRKYEQGLAPDDIAGVRWIYANGTAPPTPTPVVPHPYPSPHAAPGLVQAEDYDAGGEGIAYHDFEPANLGGAYRPSEGVDIETSGGITDVGWVRTGEWLTYTVNATSTQDVMIRLRVSNPDAATKEIPILVNENYVSAVWVPSTGSFGTFATIDSGPFWLPAGETVIRLVFEQIDRVDLDWLEFAPAVTAVPGSSYPTDTNGDGKYDDVNGNSRADFADVVLYFNQMTWIAENEPLWAFDYNGNSHIDFADVVWLFNHLRGPPFFPPAAFRGPARSYRRSVPRRSFPIGTGPWRFVPFRNDAGRGESDRLIATVDRETAFFWHGHRLS